MPGAVDPATVSVAVLASAPGVRSMPSTGDEVMATEANALSASVADTGADVARPTNAATVAGHEATGAAGRVITPVLVIDRSSMPTHSSLPGASVVRTRTWTTGRSSAAAGSGTSIVVDMVSPAAVASSMKPSGTLA